MIELIIFITLVFTTVIIHEIGHILFALKQGIYIKMTIHPSLTFFTHLKKEFERPTDYLYGIIFSGLMIPSWICFFIYIGQPIYISFWITISILIVIGLMDILIFIYESI